MKTASYSRQCKAVYRRCALRITSSFCRVSEEAALVAAGTIPIDLLAAERRTGSTGSRTQRSNTIEAWQRRWNNATTGRWTHKLIPSLTPWLQRRHGQVDFYLHRFKHEPNPYCDHCGTGSIEDAEHALFICPLYDRNRAEAENQSKWDVIANMAAGILMDLKHRERSRRNDSEGRAAT